MVLATGWGRIVVLGFILSLITLIAIKGLISSIYNILLTEEAVIARRPGHPVGVREKGELSYVRKWCIT